MPRKQSRKWRQISPSIHRKNPSRGVASILAPKSRRSRRRRRRLESSRRPRARARRGGRETSRKIHARSRHARRARVGMNSQHVLRIVSLVPRRWAPNLTSRVVMRADALVASSRAAGRPLASSARRARRPRASSRVVARSAKDQRRRRPEPRTRAWPSMRRGTARA